MSYEIRYTPEAEETFLGIYTFILSKFGQRAATIFAAKTDKIIRLIAKNPLM